MVVALWFSIVMGSCFLTGMAAIIYKGLTSEDLPFIAIWVLLGFIILVSLVFIGKILWARRHIS